MSPSPERILVRAPTWVGDAVMATPALRSIRRTINSGDYGNAQIAVEAVCELLPCLADVPPSSQLARIYYLEGAAAAMLDLPERARRAYSDALAIYPDLSWDQRLTPLAYERVVPVRQT